MATGARNVDLPPNIVISLVERLLTPISIASLVTMQGLL